MSVKVQITQPSSVNLNLTTGNSITIGSDGDSHNDLKGIQGGTVGQRYHLTQDEVALIHQNDLDIDTVSGLLTTDLVIATGELNDRLTTAESDISTLENATGQLLEQIVSNDNDISTISGLLSNDALTDIVFQTGNQIISGLKVFEDDLGVNANINLTGDLSIDGKISTVDSIQLDTAAGITVGQGELAWNSEDLTVDLGLDTNVTLQVGQEQVVRVKCTDPLGVYDGMPVYAYGTIGGSDNIEVRRFSAAAEGVDELYFIGVATETIAQNNVGFVTTFGRVRNVDGRAYGTNQGVKDPADTGNWQFGDVLYVSPNVSGTLTTIVPTSPDKRMAIAMVLKAPNQSNITLMVRAEHGYHLNELHDVYAGTPSDGQALIYNAANERWENTTLNLAYLPLSGGTLTGSLDITGDLTVDTDTLYVDSADSRVGIGTTNPLAKLHVEDSTLATVRIGAGTRRINLNSYSGDWNYNTSLGAPYIIGTQDNNWFYIYSNNTQRIGVSNGGNVTINETGADADFRVEGDTDTHLLFTDASADKVGIGTSSPSAKLDIVGGSSVGDALEVTNASYIQAVFQGSANSGGIAIKNNTGYTYEFQTNNSNSFFLYDRNALQYRAFLNSAGNLGLGGVTAPGAKLQIDTASAGTKGLIVKGAASQTANLQEWQDSTGNALSYITYDGIGVFNGFQARIQYGGGGRVNTTANYGVGGLTITNPSTTLYWGVYKTAGDSFDMITNQSQDLRFTFDGTERVRFGKTGNVGIGTSSPNARLHSLGTSEQLRLGYDASNYASFTIDSSGGLKVVPTGENFTIERSGTANRTQFIVKNSTDGAQFSCRTYGAGYSETLFGNAMADSSAIISQNDSKFILGAYGAVPLIFGTNNAERMRIDSSGNVGIGTTTPGAKLQIDTASAGTKGLILKGAASQTANLQEWQDDSGTTIGWISKAGGVYVGRGAGTGHTYADPNGNYFDCSNGGIPGGLILGGDTNTNTRTNGVAKVARIGIAPYDTSKRAIAMLVGSSVSAGSTVLYFGGGTSIMEPATQVEFQTGPIGGSGVSRLSIDSSGRTVINETAVSSADLRVEGATDPNLLFTDASADKVGIGTTTPDEKLTVVGNISNTGRIIRSVSTYTGTDTTDNVAVHVCNSATAFTLTVTDANVSGEEIKIINKGSGTVTLSGTINTTTATTTLLTGETVVLIWDGSEWI